jgi:excisionase family DNA binding protein
LISLIAFISDECHLVPVMSTTLEPSRLSPSDQGALRSLLDALHGPSHPTNATITVGNRPISLPTLALGLVTELVEHLAAGRSVTVLSGEEEISPREAAELLGVSRPFASRLFDEGQIPSRRVGTHRRAFVKDVLAYRERQHAARLAALDELAAEGQRLNLG